jgi:hypothetical protein
MCCLAAEGLQPILYDEGEKTDREDVQRDEEIYHFIQLHAQWTQNTHQL